jgi:hypothetical protein
MVPAMFGFQSSGEKTEGQGTRMLKQTTIIRLTILLLLTILTGGMAAVLAHAQAESGEAHLKEVRALMAGIANVHYARHEVVEKATSGYEFLPEVVKKVLYFAEEGSKLPFRVDYFKRRLLLADIFLARQYFFDKGGGPRYEVWTDADNALIRLVYISPVEALKKDDNTEDRTTEYFYYDRSGTLTKRWVSIAHLDHNKKKATFTDTVFDGRGKLIKEDSGDAVYEEFE